MIKVLTPTGARPEAFSACVGQMRNQDTEEDVTWVVVDDGPEPFGQFDVPDNWRLHYLRPDEKWREGVNTQASNLRLGLEFVRPTDKLVIVEDDDQYAPWWLQACSKALELHDLVGESESLYINKNTGRWKNMGNREHASLCSTAMTRGALALFRLVCSTRKTGIDIELWSRYEGSKKLYPPDPRGVTGIKGWPGRAGIGVGHKI